MEQKQFNYLAAPRNATVPECHFCGKKHKRSKLFCSAYGKICFRCQGRNHFKIKCRIKIHQVQKENNEEKDFSSDKDHLHQGWQTIDPRVTL